MKHSEYNELGRTIAAKHISILHTKQQEHFARVLSASALSGVMYLEEFFQKKKSKLHFPFVLWESYDNGYSDNGGDNKMKAYKAAFIVLIKSKTFEEQEANMDLAEEIAEDILSYLIKFFDEDPRRGFFKIANSNIEKVGPVDGDLFGARCEYIFHKPANAALYYKPAKWVVPAPPLTPEAE